jgi:inorganic pyrophosphatase
VNAARSSASAAVFNVDSLRQQRAQTLDAAFEWYQSADAAYAAASSKAFSDVSNAKAELERAQAE